MPATELLALGTGLAAGIIFAATNLPIPAPPNLAGILGSPASTSGSRRWSTATRSSHSCRDPGHPG